MHLQGTDKTISLSFVLWQGSLSDYSKYLRYVSKIGHIEWNNEKKSYLLKPGLFCARKLWYNILTLNVTFDAATLKVGVFVLFLKGA